MKKQHIFQNALLTLLMLFGLAACQDREILTIENQSPAIVMDLSQEELFLDSNFPDNLALTIAWDVAKYSQPTELKYKVEASADESFEVPYVMGTVSGSQRVVSYTVGEMNKAAQTLGLTANEQGSLYFRVSSYIGEAGEYVTSTSNTTMLTITPYELEYPTFYLVGGATAAGWDAGLAIPLYKTSNMSYIYTYLTGNEPFRFLGQANWNPLNYSIDQAGTRENYRYFKQVSSNLVQDGDENMKFTGTSGMYKISIDAATAVQSIEVEASPVAGWDFPEIYMVGSMNGWSATAPLTMAQVSPGIYEIVTPLGADAEFKFIGQKDWGDLEWGNILKDNHGYSGYVGPKGDNGNVKFVGNGGSYKVTVNLKAGTYTIVSQ